MSPEVRKRLCEIVFYQRPLKAPKVGKCTLIPGENGLPRRIHCSIQRRRLLEELNALQIILPANPRRR